MKLIPNEARYAEKCLKYNKVDKSKPARSIRVVARYFYLVHSMTLDEVMENIKGYIENCEISHKVSDDFLKEYIPKVLNEGTPMNEIESIHITKEELETIQNSGYKKSWRKVLFTMLVHYRTKMVWNGVDNYKIENNETEIIKDAHVTLSRDKRIEMWRQMENDGFITFGVGKGALKLTLNYMSDTDTYNNSNAIEITDFDDFYMYYEAYEKKSKVKECQGCGKLFIPKANKSLYCDSCKDIQYKERHKKYNSTRQN